ncbi:MAG: hypothetical protein JO061_22495 [Acidobacteriaceae bacterium]|nr:hypothetical protein [Acidobacteriaceae bacterium]
MAATISAAGSISVPAKQQAGTPWYVWCAVLAVTSAMIGGHWDVSWHSSIGRDTFWTPAHIAIYMCGVLSGIAFGYLILSTTFSPQSPLRASSIRVWGFRGPLGAFIAAWGGIVMLTSAPFDNWWHNAYGLDVQIVSPPHMVLFLGLYFVVAGTIILISGHANRVAGKERTTAYWLFLYVAGMGLIMLMFMIMEFTSRAFLHTARPYFVIALLAPIPLSLASRATPVRYAATAVAALYTFVLIALILILPLFPAEPKLGPVYQHVTQFIPPQFPILILAPALALDLFWARTKAWNTWLLSIASSAVFLAVLLLVEWPFANFLMSPLARNRFFGTIYFWYSLPPGSYTARYLLVPQDISGLLEGLMLAFVAGVFAFRFGFWRGDWMARIKR